MLDKLKSIILKLVLPKQQFYAVSDGTATVSVDLIEWLEDN
jgi:hypothetical protein